MTGGVHGTGACVAGGLHGRGMCMARGHVWQGVCVAGGRMHGRRDGHCSGRYASYWNAFLFRYNEKHSLFMLNLNKKTTRTLLLFLQ